MSQSTYQYGELVDISIRGARVDHHADGSLYIQVPNAAAGSLIPLGDAVTVTLVQPADGPAQVGDIWRTPAGVRWFAYEEMQYGKPALFLTSGELRGYSLQELCGTFGAPELEYRVPQPAAPTVEQPVVNRRFDKDGDEWRQVAEGGWVMFENGARTYVTRDTLAAVEYDFGPLTNPDEPITPPVVDPAEFGPCSGLAADPRDNTCQNSAAEYVEYQSGSVGLVDDEGVFAPGMTLRRLCTPCANAAPEVFSRKPLTTPAVTR